MHAQWRETQTLVSQGQIISTDLLLLMDCMMHNYNFNYYNDVLTITTTGPLQLQFLSGTLKRPIFPHYELYQDIAEYPFYPCSCIDLNEDSRAEIHIMWVAMEEDGNLNHIIPLLPRRENRGNWLINSHPMHNNTIGYFQSSHDFFYLISKSPL